MTPKAKKLVIGLNTIIQQSYVFFDKITHLYQEILLKVINFFTQQQHTTEKDYSTKRLNSLFSYRNSTLLRMANPPHPHPSEQQQEQEQELEQILTPEQGQRQVHFLHYPDDDREASSHLPAPQPNIA